MANRCPKAKPLGGFYLPDTRLVFRGVADIVPDPDYICPVVLWEITHDCLRALDKLEGYPTLYGRKKVNCGWLVYEMNDKTRTSPPNGGYYKMIEDGYKEFGLDDYCLRRALSEAEEVAA
jgi:hypothetical protein